MKTDFYLPYSSGLPIQKLAAVFGSTTASYKFFWFLGILELIEDNQLSAASDAIKKNSELTLQMSDIAIKMVKNSWYPLYCRLSLGEGDQLSNIADEIRTRFHLSEDAQEKEVEKKIKSCSTYDTLKLLKSLLKYVPYKFISPWTGSHNKDTLVIEESQNKTFCCIYSIIDKNTIIIPSEWREYLSQNLAILKDFIYWNLFLYLQRRNPHDQFIANKIFRKEQRESLNLQRKLWDYAIDKGISIFCPYTGKKIITRDYDLDHFIPWRYVCNNLMWNLTPADPSINRSKSDNLPDLDLYIEQFAFNQREIVKVLAKDKLSIKNVKTIKDDYTSLGITLGALADKNEDEIVKFYDKLIRPYFIQANSVGFSIWKFNQQIS